MPITLRQFLVFSLLLPSSSLVNAQVWKNEASNWLFGSNAGLRFSYGSTNPSPITARNLTAGEGTTAISDTGGNLLFYVGTHKNDSPTSQSSVFAANDSVMQGGRNTVIGGSSSSQNGIAVRMPGSFRYYYIFSVAQNENYVQDGQGFYYTRIDMQGDAGLGIVVPDSVSIPIIPEADERITATLHENGRWVWILAHVRYTNRFCAVLLTEAGPQRPVFSEAGIWHRDPSNPTNDQVTRGCMKFSPDGTRLGVALTAPLNSRHYMQVLHFDRQSGIVSDPITFTRGSATGFGPYGVEFSPDSKLVYFSDRQRKKIYQYDLSLNDSIVIVQSLHTMTVTDEPMTLQLGIDGRLYFALGYAGTSIPYLRNPNVSGSGVGLTVPGVALVPRTTSDRGLTNVVTNTFDTTAIVTGTRHSIPKITARLYPQPANDHVSLDFSKPLAYPATAEFVNTAGVTLFSQSVSVATQQLRLEIGQYPAGTYSVRLTMKGQTTVWPVSKN